ncbi:DUF2231 domain-containing protein [Hydrogenobacter thermophilus]|uniref:DUF2231 domain-containing protein n=1 Tax=Hydrogenobacter thermophilus TaxID=940 RepID=UPI0030F54631
MELVKLHPPMVHFAIAFPLFLLFTDIYYRWVKKSPDGLHAMLTYVSVFAVLGGTASGIIAHKPIEEKLHQIPVFEAHEILGISLSILFLLLGALRFFLGGYNTRWIRDAYTSLLLLGVLLLFLQGRWGGMIVYDYLLKIGL